MSPDRQSAAAVEDRLRALRAPDEAGAAERGLALVRAAFAEREPVRPRWQPLHPVRLLAAVLAAVAVAAFALSPAGASVRDWIDDALEDRDTHAPAPLQIPAPGQVLTVNGAGAWIAHNDGSVRSLGPWTEAGFSPRGLNVVVAERRELAAIGADDGELRWKLTAAARIADPAWAPTSGGIRIAYRSGSEIRVVEGDGTGDRSFAGDVAPVAPAWRPPVAGEPDRDVLAWAGDPGTVEIADVVSTAAPAAFGVHGSITRLAWLDGGRIAVATDRELAVYTSLGERQASFRLPRGARVADLSASPDGERIAYSRTVFGPHGPRAELVLARVAGPEPREQVLFAGPGAIEGVAFAPDGSYVGFGWPAADAWLFARPADRTKRIETIDAAPDISARFSARPGASGSPPPGYAGSLGFPAFDDWCC